MSTQLHDLSRDNPLVSLPPSLRLPFLDGLTARQIIAKADWFIRVDEACFRRDVEQGAIEHYYLSTHRLDHLCCLVPAPDAPRPENDIGMPRGLADWILRRRIAEAALPQQGLPMPLREQAARAGLSAGGGR